MSDQPKDFVLELHAGTEREGIWCGTCQTWARWEVDVLTMDDSGVNRLSTVKRCARCLTDAEEGR